MSPHTHHIITKITVLLRFFGLYKIWTQSYFKPFGYQINIIKNTFSARLWWTFVTPRSIFVKLTSYIRSCMQLHTNVTYNNTTYKTNYPIATCCLQSETQKLYGSIYLLWSIYGCLVCWQSQNLCTRIGILINITFFRKTVDSKNSSTTYSYKRSVCFYYDDNIRLQVEGKWNLSAALKGPSEVWEGNNVITWLVEQDQPPKSLWPRFISLPL